MSEPLKLLVVGAGHMAQEYAESWLDEFDLEILAVADPNASSRVSFASVCEKKRGRTPAQFVDEQSMLSEFGKLADAAYVATPHAFHAAQAAMLLQNGIDVFLEKPTAVDVKGARKILEAQKDSGNILVVAYQGVLSPLVQRTREEITLSRYGGLRLISGLIWENWRERYVGHWKQNSSISGGGFMFDTGAHMLNTCLNLAGVVPSSVTAHFNNMDREIDILSSICGMFDGSVPFSLCGVGDTKFACDSMITLIFEEAILKIDAWGKWRSVETPDGEVTHESNEHRNNPMAVFQAVRDGSMRNPSTAEAGLRFAKVWQAIQWSAAQEGQPINPANMA